MEASDVCAYYSYINITLQMQLVLLLFFLYLSFSGRRDFSIFFARKGDKQGVVCSVVTAPGPSYPSQAFSSELLCVEYSN